MDDILNKLEKVLELLKKESDKKMRLQGKYDAKMDELKKLGINSLVEAKNKIKTLEVKSKKIEMELENLLTKFEKEYPQLLETE
jgi:hypothetical protein